MISSIASGGDDRQPRRRAVSRVPRFRVGDSGYQVEIDSSWRVLDVGSGESPHTRANVLIDRFPDDNSQRSGQALDRMDPRFVVGDALMMPFEDMAFDYSITSHIAEHVDDPAQLCRELTRVSRAGYIETPGWLWDLFIHESFHPWRVRRVGRGLRFDRVHNRRRLGLFGDLLYGLVYMGAYREGHWTLRSRWRPLNSLLFLGTRIQGRLRRLPGIRRVLFTCYEWQGEIPVEVRGSIDLGSNGPRAPR